MDAEQLRQLRLHNQLLSNPAFPEPEEVVRWLVAVQAQDIYGAFWALGLRLPAAKESDISRAFDEGRILRTHVLRPTWHFVAPADIRGLLRLTAPRVHQANGTLYRQEGLDAKLLVKAHKVIERALLDNQYKTRKEIAGDLDRAPLPSKGLGLAYIMMHAELEGLICSGPRRDKQFTYALLDERVPKEGKVDDPEEVLAKFAQRFIRSRGPATYRDLAHWSGLTATTAKRAIDMVSDQLESVMLDGSTFWFVEPDGMTAPNPTKLYLLPNYDEYVSAYTSRLDGLIDPALDMSAFLDYSFSHILMLDGQIIGTWRRDLQAAEVEVEIRVARPLDADKQRLLEMAAASYAAFLQKPIRLI